MQKMLGWLVLGASFAAPLGGQGVGAVAGLVSSKFSISNGNGAGQQSRTGFAVGLSFPMAAGKTLDFVPEVLYTQKGSTAASSSTPVDIKLTYLEAPLLFRYTIPGSGEIRPFLLAGPEIAFKLGCNLSANSGSAHASVACKDDPQDFADPKSVDYGLVFGAGVSAQRFLVSVRYDLGLANIVDNAGNSTAKNAALFFLVGIHF